MRACSISIASHRLYNIRLGRRMLYLVLFAKTLSIVSYRRDPRMTAYSPCIPVVLRISHPPCESDSDFSNFPQSSNRGSSRSGSRRPEALISLPIIGLKHRFAIAESNRVGIGTYETVHAPPATVFLQALQVQIPTECRFTVFLPQKVQVYLACCVISIFLTCFRSEAPYL